MGMAGANGFAGGATARIFLGLFEACVNPVSILLTAQYYTRKEHSLRSCIWWAGASIGAFFGDLVAWGLGHDHGSLNSWRYMFLVWGSATIFWSIVLFFFLPNSPWKMKFLSERERKIAVLRVSYPSSGLSTGYTATHSVHKVLSNHTGYKSNWFKFDQWSSVSKTHKPGSSSAFPSSNVFHLVGSLP
jgi:MFS family permease